MITSILRTFRSQRMCRSFICFTCKFYWLLILLVKQLVSPWQRHWSRSIFSMPFSTSLSSFTSSRYFTGGIVRCAIFSRQHHSPMIWSHLSMYIIQILLLLTWLHHTHEIGVEASLHQHTSTGLKSSWTFLQVGTCIVILIQLQLYIMYTLTTLLHICVLH